MNNTTPQPVDLDAALDGEAVSIRPDACFVDDHWLAQRIGMKVSTIRSQRFKRRHGLPHWLDLDPVMIGSKPRYRLSSALEWLQGRGQQNTAKLPNS